MIEKSERKEEEEGEKSWQEQHRSGNADDGVLGILAQACQGSALSAPSSKVENGITAQSSRPDLHCVECTLSDKTLSDKTLSDKTLSDKTLSDKTLSDKTLSDKTHSHCATVR
ncbi:hypothetical protein B0T19DRAFT_400815 [Cercophora scortea]|uniref:Uncharacterized protein n=1 Tax=Cercophora scortea TaxID=314031 RepID=A0AAE0IN26_9PEZI|nr:hypothetical protein B0T19DRAFT_400815 [Cercophora scortea]